MFNIVSFQKQKTVPLKFFFNLRAIPLPSVDLSLSQNAADVFQSSIIPTTCTGKHQDPRVQDAIKQGLRVSLHFRGFHRRISKATVLVTTDVIYKTEYGITKMPRVDSEKNDWLHTLPFMPTNERSGVSSVPEGQNKVTEPILFQPFGFNGLYELYLLLTLSQSTSQWGSFTITSHSPFFPFERYTVFVAMIGCDPWLPVSDPLFVLSTEFYFCYMESTQPNAIQFKCSRR